MRADMVPGAVFPDYELPDHATKRQKLSALQGQHPMVLVLSRGGYCPKDRRQHELLVNIVNLKLATAVWSPSAPTTSLRQTNFGAESVRIGLSYRIRHGKFKRISTSPNTLIRITIR